MSGQEKKISISMIARQVNMDPTTIKQLCETGQIPEKCFVVYDKGSDMETWFFFPSLTIKAIGQWEKEQKANAKEAQEQKAKEKKAKEEEPTEPKI